MTEKSKVTFTLVVEKGDDGGYRAIYGDGAESISRCCTTLPEILTWSGLKAGITCNEPPYQMASPPGYQEAMERAMQHQRTTQYQQPPHPHEHEPERFPDVIERERERVQHGGMLDRFGGAFNGNAAAVVAVMFLAGMAISRVAAGLA